MLPINVVPVPRVAELPTFQKTLQATPPLMTATVEVAAVIRVEPVLKIHTLSGAPWASRRSVPVKKALLVKE